MGMKYNCSNLKNGCQEVLTETALEDHEPECIYREVPCLLKAFGWHCDEKVTFQDVIQHFQNHKKTRFYEGKLKVKFFCNWNNELSFSGKNCFTSPFKFDLNNQTFILARKTKDKVVYAWVYILGSLNEAKHFSYTLKLFGPKTINTFEGQVAAIDESFETLSEAGKCFTLPHKTFVAQFLHGDRKYEYSLEIRKLEDPFVRLARLQSDNLESGISDNDEESKK